MLCVPITGCDTFEMSNYRRAFLPGGAFFFTVKTERNMPIFRNNFAAKSLVIAFVKQNNCGSLKSMQLFYCLIIFTRL